MIAPATPPLAAPTITDSAVAMKSALPRPQPARKPTICATLPDAPASAVNTTTSASPRAACAARCGSNEAGDEHRDAGDREVAGEQQLDLARRGVEVLARAGRIGSTSPMPMNATTAANATAQTAFGWRSRPVLKRSPRRGARGSAPRRRASRAPRGRARRPARRGWRHACGAARRAASARRA